MAKNVLLSLAASVGVVFVLTAETLPWGWYPGTSFDYTSDGTGLEIDGRGSNYFVPSNATVRVRNSLGVSVLETVPGATAVGSILLKDLQIGIDANDRATISGGLLRVPSGVDLALGAGPAGTESVISNLVLEAGASTLYAFGPAGATQSLVNVSADIKVLAATGGVLKLAGRIDQPRTFRVSGCAKANTPEVVVGRGAWLANGGWVNIGNRIGSANSYGKVRVTDGGRLGPASVNVATADDASYEENGTLIIEKGASVDLNFNRMGLGWNYKGKPRLEVRDGGMLRGIDWLCSWNNHSIMWADVIFKDGRIQHTSRDYIGFDNGHIALMGGMHMEVDGGWYSFYEIANSNAGSQIAGQSFWLNLISGFFAIDCGTPNAQNSASCDVWFNLHDGAIFETAKFRCDFPDRYKTKGGLAQLRLDSDGGRLRRKVAGNPAWYYPTAASVDFVPYYCVASIGAKGLAIESDNAISLSAPFYDTSAGATAKLSLEGRGVKTLTSTNSFEKTLEVAGGKTVFGAKILGSGTAVHSSHAVVTNGAVLSLAGAGTATTLKGLTVSCGALELDTGDLFTVDGDVALDTVAVLFTSDFAEAGTRDVLVMTNGTASAAAKAAWANGQLLAGRAADTAYTFTTRDEADSTVFSVTATADAGATKGFTYTAGGKDFAASGTANALAREVSASESWSNLKLPAKVTAEVAEDETLTVSGTQAGRIVKRGKGKLVLDGKNGFADGLDIDGGVVDVKSAAALGTRGFQAVEMTAGTLQLSDPTPDVFFPMQLVANVTNGYQTVKGTGSYTNVVVLKADSDIRMPFYNAYNGKGTGFIKRGAGAVTFLPRIMAQQGVYIGMSRAHEDKNSYPTTSDVTTFHEDGSVSGYHGLWDIAEGKVVLRDGTYGFMTYNRCCIGLPTTQGTANPELVLDGAGLKNQYDYAFYVGCGFGSANSFATGARLVLTNGAQIGSWVGGLQFGKNSTKACTNEFVVTDSSVHLNSTIGANLSANVKAVSRFTIRDSLFRSNGFEIYGPIFLDVARSDFRAYGKGSGGTWGSYSPTQLENAFFVCHEAAGNGGSELVFRDKTRLNVGRFQASATYAKPVTVAFDDAIVTNGYSQNCAITVQNPNSFRFELRKGGVTFPVSEGQTLRNVMKLTGEGGLTKTGPGTLVFDSRETNHSGKKDANDPLTLCYTGATTVVEGTLVLTNGSVRAGAEIALASGTTLDLSGESWNLGTVGGAGTVRNGALVGTCFDLAPTNTTVIPETLVFGDNLTVTQPSIRLMIADDGSVPGKINLGTTRFSGRVKVTLVRDEAHPFTTFDGLEDLEIGSYTGAAPDVSTWRIRGLGASAKAVAADGKIRATVTGPGGLMLIVR